jgi:hypothetical protein
MQHTTPYLTQQLPLKQERPDRHVSTHSFFTYLIRQPQTSTLLTTHLPTGSLPTQNPYAEKRQQTRRHTRPRERSPPLCTSNPTRTQRTTAHIGQEPRTPPYRIIILLQHLKHMYLLYIVHTLIYALYITPHDCDPVFYLDCMQNIPVGFHNWRYYKSIERLHINTIADHIYVHTSKETPPQHIPTKSMLFYMIIVVS